MFCEVKGAKFVIYEIRSLLYFKYNKGGVVVKKRKTKKSNTNSKKINRLSYEIATVAGLFVILNTIKDILPVCIPVLNTTINGGSINYIEFVIICIEFVILLTVFGFSKSISTKIVNKKNLKKTIDLLTFYSIIISPLVIMKLNIELAAFLGLLAVISVGTVIYFLCFTKDKNRNIE